MNSVSDKWRKERLLPTKQNKMVIHIEKDKIEQLCHFIYIII